MDEKQAIAQLKKGNLEGLETLVKTNQVKAIRTACLITGDLALAEDVVQDAFLRVYACIDQFNDELSFTPWFTRIVINNALKVLRRQKRILSMEADDTKGDFDLFDSTPLPEEALQSKQTLQAIWQAINKLPPPQRAAFVMRYYLQMSEKEIADILHGPIGTIKWWAFSARQKLRLSLFTSPTEGLSEQDCNPGKGA
jgi:RNA polymerase sigma-70 factor (ECF subfamily)